ncbi:MAG: hypothetical protein KME32_26070 [Mojavia pulchra JT2-VF2]|uniref:Uncharacterized protein n=1 Tax=Mojavia pulchra JT2-VF2 TaxID=287848 RepID=A0A951Q4L3_9NOST|nr:hypothetical protein [Mojavia pulchra JT2-VF2]
MELNQDRLQLTLQHLKQSLRSLTYIFFEKVPSFFTVSPFLGFNFNIEAIQR